MAVRSDPVRSPLLAAVLALLAACAAQRAPARAAAPAPTDGAAAVPAPGWTRRAFPVRDRGKLLLALPPGWTAREGETGEAAAPAIRLEAEGARFTALLTPLWNPGEESPAARADTARLFAELGRRRALQGSVEREIALEELSGPGVTGFWFTATDRDLVGREPGPEEWRHVVQGAAAVGPVILAFTLLDDGPGPQRGEVLEIVRTARHVDAGREEGGDALGDLVPVPEDRTAPLRVAWPGKPWALLVDLPGFRLGERRGGAGRGTFVVGFHPALGVAASVSLDPAGAATDAAACREIAMAAIAAAIPALAHVRRSDAPLGVRATYVAPGEAGPEAHAHAFLFRDGLCATVHVSKVEPEPGDDVRLDAILATARFAEDL